MVQQQKQRTERSRVAGVDSVSHNSLRVLQDACNEQKVIVWIFGQHTWRLPFLGDVEYSLLK